VLGISHILEALIKAQSKAGITIEGKI